MTDNLPWYIAVPLAAVLVVAYLIIVRVQNSRDSK